MRQAWKTDEKKQDEMRKHGKKKGDRMKALKKDGTMMVGKKDKMFEEFQKICWRCVGRRMDEKLSVIHSSSANFDPEKGLSMYLLILFIPWDLLVNCSV